MGLDEVILLRQSGCSNGARGLCRSSPAASCSHVPLDRGCESLGVELGVCELPAPGFCVGLSQSECYCKVSGFTGEFLSLCLLHFAVPLSPVLPAPPCTAPPPCFHLSACTFTPVPTNPSLHPSFYPSTGSAPSSSLCPHVLLVLICGYQLAVMGAGKQGLHSASSPPSRGSLGRPTLALLRPSTRGGEMD